MGVISLTSGFLLFIFYLPTLIGAWKEAKIMAARREAIKNGTLATQGDGEISGLMWADVGAGGGFGGGGGF